MSEQSLDFNIQVGAIPTGFRGDWQAGFNLLEEILKVSVERNFSFFRVSATEPPSNQGPWLNTSLNPAEWYVYDDTVPGYVPLGIPNTSLGYIISTTAPDPAIYDLWFEVDSLGGGVAIRSWNGTQWIAYGYTRSEVDSLLDARTPIGSTMAWWQPSIPTGWAIMDGGTYNGITVPDWRDKFIVGAGGGLALGDLGGSVSKNGVLSGTTEAHILTTAQMPAHTHGIGLFSGAGAPARVDPVDGPSRIATTQTDSEGGGQAHTHNLGGLGSCTISDARPPFYSAYWITYVGT